MADEVSRGMQLAFRALARKERTAAEMRELLAKAEIPPADIDSVMEELKQIGAVNDAHFAVEFTAGKRSLSAWGNERIREALLSRGVDASLIEEALAGEDEGSELDRAVELLKTRGFDLTIERDRARALGLLARRGYGSDVAYEAIRLVESGRDGGR